jgi:hypothetical protein
MANKRQPKTVEGVPEVDPTEVIEVAEYIEAEQTLQEYLDDVRKNHPGVLETLYELAERRNAALENADKVVRAREVRCGPFQVHLVKPIYNPEALYDAVGKERFLELGGSITEKPVYEVDGKRLDAAIAMGKLSPDVAAAVRGRQVQYKGIGKVGLP